MKEETPERGFLVFEKKNVDSKGVAEPSPIGVQMITRQVKWIRHRM
jgi:hypothetical protein